MTQMVLVGIGAGVAAALLFASLASGAFVSIILFSLSPLPILVAALGWSHWSGLIAALVASIGLALGLGDYFFIASIGLPAWWLGYIALLARPAPPGEEHVEWYPPGRLVLWCSIIGALIVIAAIALFGLDQNGFQTALRTALERAFDSSSNMPADPQTDVSGVDLTPLIDDLVRIVPLAAAMLSSATFAFNLWLAGTVVRISGRLPRPWPAIPAMTLPRFALALVAASILGALLPSYLGTVCAIFAATLCMAFALVGFAVLHSVTRPMTNRRLVLAAVYVVVAVLGWTVLIMTLLGLADTAFDLRTRFGQKSAPPPAPQV
jgi:magnesium-transporting ATPase (P-type)